MKARELIEAEDPKALLRQYPENRRITIDNLRRELAPHDFTAFGAARPGGVQKLIQYVGGALLCRVQVIPGAGAPEARALISVFHRKPRGIWKLHIQRVLWDMDSLLSKLRELDLIK